MPKYNYKKDALTDYFKGKLSAKELDKIARKDFGVGIATKKELNSFLTNKFTQDVMSDTYGIPNKTLVKRARDLVKFAESMQFEGMFSTIDQIRQDSENVRDFVKNVFADRDFKKMKNDKDFIKYLKSVYESISDHPKASWKDKEETNEGFGNWIKAKNLTAIVKLSKQKKNATFYVTDDNNSSIYPFWLKNGKFAKATTANSNWDFQRNKTKVKDRSDVIYKYKIDESINEILVIVDKFDKKKQSYGKIYYRDGGKRPGDGDLKKANKELEKLSKKHKGLTLVSVGRSSKMYDVHNSRESVNEAIKPSQVRSAISKVKKQLMRKWKQKGGYENFGQKELDKMKSKFKDNPYGSSDERQISKMLDGFDNWAMNYDGNMREAYLVAYGKGPKPMKPAFAAYADKKLAQKFMADMKKDGYKVMMTQKKIKGLEEGKKRFKRQDGIGKAKYTISFHDGRKKHKDGSDFFDIKIFKNKKDLSNFVGTLVKKGYKPTNESVNEGSIDWEKNFKGFNEKELKVIQKFIWMNPNGIDGVIKMSKKKDFKPFVQKAAKKGLGESVNEAKTKESKVVQMIYKYEKNEKKFYDKMAEHEKRIGTREYKMFIAKALRGFGINLNKYKSIPDAEEKLYQTVSQ